MSVAYKKLEEVCDILDAHRVPITAKDREAGIYPYYGANGLQDYVAEYIFDAPTFVYHIGMFAVDKNGTLTGPLDHALIRWLADEGFTTEE